MVRAKEYFLPEEILHHIESVFNTVQALPLISKNFLHSDDKQVVRIFLWHCPITFQWLHFLSLLLKAFRKTTAAGNVQRVSEGGTHLHFQPTDNTIYTTVSYLNSLYGIPSNTGSNAASQAVLAFDTGTTTQCFSQSDLQAYQQAYGVPDSRC